MKIKIGNKIYTSEDQPIMVIFSASNKETIANMPAENYKFCEFAKGMDEDEVKYKQELAYMERAAGELRDFPELRAERVCNHYMRLGLFVRDMHDAIELRKLDPNKELDDLIELHLEVVNGAHKIEFGKGLWEEKL